MKVKDLITLFSADVDYQIKYVDNVHDLVWWGRGNKLTHCVDEEEIVGISKQKNKIIIYIY